MPGAAISAKDEGRLDNIDGLRALAVIAVLLFHYTSAFDLSYYKTVSVPFRLEAGHYGVDLFFMVSGYCIFMTLERSRSLAAFWSRRIARLQPAYVAAVLLTMLTMAIFPLPGRTVSIVAAIGNLFWLEMIPTWPMVDGAYWSLLVELKFYFWFGLLYFLSGRRLAVAAWAAFATAAAGVALLGSIIPFGRVVTTVADVALIAPYGGLFLIGLVGYEARKGWTIGTLAAAALGIALIASSSRFAGHQWIGVAIALFALAVFRMTWLRLPRAITFVGLVSYSLYLVHQNIGLSIIRALADSVPSYELRMLIATLAVFGIASAIYVTVELRWGRPLARLLERMLAPIIALATVPWRTTAIPTEPRPVPAIDAHEATH